MPKKNSNNFQKKSRIIMEKFLNNNNEEISETALPLSQSYQATDLFAYSPPSITS